MKLLRQSILPLLLTVVAACDGGAPSEQAAAETAPETGVAASHTPSAEESDAIAVRAEASLASLDASDPQGLRERLPEHRAAVTGVIDDCRKMMEEHGMTPPREFTMLEDAVRADLDRLNEAPDGQLATLLPEHRERVQRMLRMRHDMM